MNVIAKSLAIVTIGGGGIASTYGIHYAIKPKTLADLLSSKEKILEQEDSTWNELVTKYKLHESGEKPIKNISLTGTNDNETLKNACTTLLTTKINNLESNEIQEKLKNIRDWCLVSSKGIDPVSTSDA